MSKLLKDKDFKSAALKLNCEEAAIRAVAEVESRGNGFMIWKGKTVPKILFERHIFHRLTKGEFDKSHPHLSNETPGGYGSESIQHDKLTEAEALDREAALQSASWGKFQVMGFNWKMVGYPDLQTFINAAFNTESDHLNMFIGFVLANSLADEIREKRWEDFARKYNGKDYKKNNYHLKMAAAYKKFSK